MTASKHVRMAWMGKALCHHTNGFATQYCVVFDSSESSRYGKGVPLMSSADTASVFCIWHQAGCCCHCVPQLHYTCLPCCCLAHVSALANRVFTLATGAGRHASSKGGEEDEEEEEEEDAEDGTGDDDLPVLDDLIGNSSGFSPGAQALLLMDRAAAETGSRDGGWI